MIIKKYDYKNLVNFLLEISKLACEEILKIYNTDHSHTKKFDNSPLTLADLNSNKIITENLSKNFPNIPVISEEDKYKNKRQMHEFFLVDPLDGTKEFLKKNDEFTVNIALIQNKKPIIGIVSLPTDKKHFYTDGFKSFVIADGKKPKIINSVKYSKRLRVLVSRSHLDKETKTLLRMFNDPIVKEKGSSIKLCLIAAGEGDLYIRFGNTMEWDVSAGHAILKNAGANLYNFSFTELTYGKEKFLNSAFFACSNSLKKEIIHFLKKKLDKFEIP